MADPLLDPRSWGTEPSMIDRTGRQNVVFRTTPENPNPTPPQPQMGWGLGYDS
jgi:hypothetical protein